MGIAMGMHPLLAKGGDKRKFRWMFAIEPYIGNDVSMLPPSKGARPNVSFKEYQAEHLYETIYFPGRVEWQTVELTLYDVKCNVNPIYNWMKLIYSPDPANSYYQPSLVSPGHVTGGEQFKTTATVTMYSGCGKTLESWVYMNAYPSKIDWGDLDMSSSELATVELTLRFDRAYLIQQQ